MISARHLSLTALLALVTSVLVAGVTSPATAALPVGCVQPVPDGTVTCTYDHTGAVQQLELPNGVTSVSVTAYGGHGATNAQASPSPGGRGALVSGTFASTPGDTLDVYVAADGGHPVGGFGLGNGAASNYTPSQLAAGGGGGSAVVDGDAVVLLVAGGGGAAGIRSNCAQSGAGGDAGHDGSPGQGCGTKSGGAGGRTGAAPGPDGTPGLFRLGGGGGGGGGGYPGGEGGAGIDVEAGVGTAAAGGGGGGASYADPAGTGVSLTGLSDRGDGAHGRVVVSFTIGTPAASVDLSPGSSTIVLGAGQSYTTVARDAGGASLGDVTHRTQLTIAPDGTCTADTCTPASAGPHTVTATYGKGSAAVNDTATLMVHEGPAFASGPQALFTLGDAGSFEVDVTGTPAPVIEVTSGTLPPGLTLTDDGDGTATIAGTPTGGVGTSDVALTATNVVEATTQDLEIVVRERPAIGPPSGGFFVVGEPATYGVTATGFPAPALSVAVGSLPAGLSFVDHGNGTGSIGGTPTGPAGTTNVTLEATNAAGTASRQVQLVVATSPAFISPAAATFVRGAVGSFTVRTDGAPAPGLQMSGKLPTGLTFHDNGDGTATVAGTPTGTAGARTVMVRATSPAGTATQELQLSVTLLSGACANQAVGTEGPDVIWGSRAGDRLRGLGGEDVLTGRAARDCLLGAAGSDTVRGGRSADSLRGGPDGDVLFGGAGRDIVRGGGGDDTIHARDGQTDQVRCGAGDDAVSADETDVLVGCETVI